MTGSDSRLIIATKLLEALAAKDLDGVMACVTETVTMDTPMGPKKGQAQTRGMFSMVTAMGGKPSAPKIDSDAIHARVDSAMTKSVMTMHFTGDLVSHIVVTLG
ncbi:nuclear transport factor 2 family protein [Bradyrhizobium sp. AZCC 1693]|uniref:nuclear transport factor 2 family protein n=1 Tax=Bradyrhizobium sp. AZCC 1693 TaxID=3117029 RepID=UPI002FF2EF37